MFYSCRGLPEHIVNIAQSLLEVSFDTFSEIFVARECLTKFKGELVLIVAALWDVTWFVMEAAKIVRRYVKWYFRWSRRDNRWSRWNKKRFEWADQFLKSPRRQSSECHENAFANTTGFVYMTKKLESIHCLNSLGNCSYISMRSEHYSVENVGFMPLILANCHMKPFSSKPQVPNSHKHSTLLAVHRIPMLFAIFWHVIPR